MSTKEKAEQFWEPLAITAALVTVPALAFEHLMDPVLGLALSATIWMVFVLEFFTVLAVCSSGQERAQWVRQAWMDPVIIVATFPFLPAAFQSLRILRVLKVSRLLALARLLKSVGQRFALHPLLLTGSVAATVVVIGGTALAVVEPETVRDMGSALWWSLTTVTTVGYGDIVPTTDMGRLIGSVVMLTGSAFTAAFSAALAAHLIRRPEEDPLSDQLRGLQEEIAELRRLLESRS